MNASITHPRRHAFVCPVDVTLSMISGKWKPMILWLLAARAQRFSDLQSAMPLIAHKVLAQQLRQLEADGVIRRIMRENPQAAGGYQLTEFGRTLRPVLNALASWGKTHHQLIGARYGAVE
ncbi:MAG: winged helix-turn-helix transcriptional regulator [Rhodanobacter sp.]